jgi:dihydroorotate dehydrogenase
MSWGYRRLARPLLFIQDSERIHNRTLAALGWVSRRPLACHALAAWFSAPELPIEICGLRFPNPVGLAAGMDKLAEAVPAWGALGFGFSELGGVTRYAQPGNSLPRVFRAIPDEALVNRMGFNNPGAEALARQLASWRDQKRWPQHPVGMNLGKTKITPLDLAAEDYAASLEVLWPHCDFYVVNVSSPNTPNLRQLQDKTALAEIFRALQAVNAQCAATASDPAVPQEMAGIRRSALPDGQRSPPRRRPKPILVKVAPDLSYPALDEILELVETCQIAGVVATNTTVTRPESPSAKLRQVYAETGGLSGRPLRQKSTEVIRHLYRQTQGRLPIIGVGGIFTAEHAWEKITAGASLVQVYTGMVYEGPSIARDIVRGLRTFLAREGLCDLRQAVGVGTGSAV